MNSLSLRDLSDSARPERVDAVAAFGFTDRQARFLVRVLVHAGVFLERQYCTFARVVHGRKSHAFRIPSAPAARCSSTSRTVSCCFPARVSHSCLIDTPRGGRAGSLTHWT